MNCFLAYLRGESGRLELCRDVLREAERGNVRIVTSALTLAEVLNLRGHEPLPKQIRKTVTDFLKHDYIVVRNVTTRVAELARDLVWDQSVKPKDAIHVATDLDAKVPMLNTFDDGLKSKNGRIGSPALVIVEPQPPAQRDLDLPKGRW